VEEIIAGEPPVNLLLYGDFNDTKNEPAVQEIMGARGVPDHMADLPLKDSAGDRWTQYWKYADIYSRIDFIFVSPALLPEVVQSKKQRLSFGRLERSQRSSPDYRDDAADR